MALKYLVLFFNLVEDVVKEYSQIPEQSKCIVYYNVSLCENIVSCNVSNLCFLLKQNSYFLKIALYVFVFPLGE